MLYAQSDAFPLDETGPIFPRRGWERGLRRWIAVFALCFGLAACAPAESLSIRDAEFRPPLGSSDVGAAYFSIRSAKADRIVAISSSEAVAVEIHTSVTEGGMMSMKRLESVPLPPGKTVEFFPGGMHLMVFSPRLNDVATAIPITIELESGAKRTVAFHLQGMSAGPRG